MNSFLVSPADCKRRWKAIVARVLMDMRKVEVPDGAGVPVTDPPRVDQGP